MGGDRHPVAQAALLRARSRGRRRACRRSPGSRRSCGSEAPCLRPVGACLPTPVIGDLLAAVHHRRDHAARGVLRPAPSSRSSPPAPPVRRHEPHRAGPARRAARALDHRRVDHLRAQADHAQPLRLRLVGTPPRSAAPSRSPPRSGRRPSWITADLPRVDAALALEAQRPRARAPRREPSMSPTSPKTVSMAWTPAPPRRVHQPRAGVERLGPLAASSPRRGRRCSPRGRW